MAVTLTRLAGAMLLATSVAAYAATPTFTVGNNVFAATAVGQSTTQNVTLTVNTAVPITGIALGSNVKEYTLGTITGCTIDPSGNTVVPANAVCTIAVTFKPLAAGKGTAASPIARSAPLLVMDIEGGKATGYSFALTGTGTGPVLSLSPGYITAFVGNPTYDGGFVEPGCMTQTDNIGDGCPATEARPYISSMALDAAGNLYIADGPVYVIHKVDAVTGMISVIAGTAHTQAPYAGYGAGGPATSAEFYNPGPITVDLAGNIYVVDYGLYGVEKINAATGILTIVAGGGSYAPGTGHTATQTSFPEIVAILADPAGNLYLASPGSGKASVYRVDALTQLVTVVAGNGTYTSPATGDGGPAASATLGSPIALAMDSGGNLYIADESNNAIRRVDATSEEISTYAGTGVNVNAQANCMDDAGDGAAATKAFISNPGALAFDSADNLYIADGGGVYGQGVSCPIRRVDATTGLIHTVAGNINGNLADQDNTSAFNTYLSPNVLAVDANGNLFVGMQWVGSAVRKIVSTDSAVIFRQQSQDVTAGPQIVLASNVGIATTLAFSNLPFSITQTPAYFLSTALAGSNPQDCAVGTLAAGATCGIGISFDPMSDGSFTGTENIDDNTLNTGTAHTIALSGSAYNEQTITLTPTPVNFGEANLNTVSQQTLTYNNLLASSKMVSATIYGGGASAFSLPAGSTCTGMISAGSNCTFPVAFEPIGVQSYTATLQASFLDQYGEDQNLFIPLSGSGQMPSAPAVTLAPATITFPGTLVDATAAAISTQVSNTGTAALTNIVVSLTGANASDFNLSANTCGTTLGVGDSCSISVTFTPSAALTFGTSISIADNAANTPQKVTLSGTGIAAPTFTIGNNVFSIPVGQTQTQNVTLTLGAAVPITSIGVLPDFPEYTLGAISGCTVDATGKTVEPSGTVCTIPVTFKPVAPGKASAAAPVARSAPLLVTDIESTVAEGYTFPLEGTATGPLASFYPGTVSAVSAPSFVGCSQETDQEGDGCPASDVTFDISGTAVDSAGNIFIVEQQAYDVRRIDGKTGIVSSIAGQWRQQEAALSGNGGPATKAGFYAPVAIAVDSEDNIYVGDYLFLSKINAATGVIHAIAGDGTDSPSQGGPAVKTAISGSVKSIVVDPAGDVFFSAFSTVYRIDAVTGSISLVVGNASATTASPETGVPGPASAAVIGSNLILALDSAGNLYIADQQNYVVYQVKASTGMISVYAGTPLPHGSQNNGCSSDTGDGGPATSAFLNAPTYIAFDAADNLYIPEAGCGVIRRVDASTGSVHVVEGNYDGGPVIFNASDSSAFDTDFDAAVAFSVDSFGNLLVGTNSGLEEIASGTASVFFPTENGSLSDETAVVTLSNIGVTTPLAFDNEPFPTSGVPYTTYPVAGPQDCASAGPLAAGESCGIGASFDPTANGTFNGTITAGDNSLNVPAAKQTVSLLGTLKNYNKITFSPNPLAFGSEPVGTPTTLNIIITDTNTITSNPTATFELGNTTSFSAGSIVCSALAGGGSTCTVPVIFTPQATGPLSCTLLLQFHDTNGSPSEDIAVSGNGTPAAASITSLGPATLAFPSTIVGQTATALMATLSNTGNAPVNDIVITIAGANPGDFATTSATTCGTSLAAGASCTIAVTFTPPSANSFGATLTVTDSDASSPQTANLTGMGAPAPMPAVTGPFDLAFNPAPVPNGIPQTLTATFQITNYATLLAPTGVTHYGSSYQLGTPSCTGSAGAQTCSVPVTFTPKYPGGRKDALFLMNGGTRLATVLLYGIGESPLSLIQPGVVTPYANVGPGGTFFIQSVVDDTGITYALDNTTNNVFKITKDGTVSTLLNTGNNSAVTLAIDGAGILYFGDKLIDYDTVQGILGTYTVPGAIGSPYQIAIGNTGNFYTVDHYVGTFYDVQPGGAYTTQQLSPPIGGLPQTLTVDDAEDVFIGGDNINEITANGTQTQVSTLPVQPSELTTDAAQTLYYANLSATWGELAASNYNAKLEEYTVGGGNTSAISMGPDGTLYGSGSYTTAGFFYTVDRSQGAISFAAQASGSASAAQLIQVYNGGNEPLTLSSFTIADPEFAIATSAANACSTSTPLGAGAVCNVGVVFTPANGIAYHSMLTISSNTLNTTSTTQMVALSGSGTGVATPTASLTPVALSFPNTQVGATSVPLTATLSNPGNVSFTISSISITGANPTDFAIAPSSSCAGTPSLGGGDDCAINVTFTPSSATSFTAYLSVADNASGSPQVVTLSGTGTPAPAPQAVLTPSTLTFPSTNVGSTAAVLTTTLANPGNATLNISGVTLGGANPSDFAISANGCGATLAANGSCMISVTFTPASAIPLSAALVVADNAANATQTVTLSGTGTLAPAPQAVLTPSTLTFPSTNVGSTSAVLTTTLANPGNATLNISGVTLAGANPSDFAISANGCGATLAASASCMISVTFTPGSATSFSAAISVADDAANSPQTVSLSGTGTPAPALDFSLTAGTPTGSVQGGATASYTFNTAGVNGAWNSPISFTAVGLPTGATYTFTPPAVTPGDATASSVLAVQTPSPLWARATAGGVRAPWLAVLLLAPLFGFTRARRMRRSRLLAILLLALSLAPLLAAAGCAGGYFQPTAQSYTITVTGTSGSTAHSTSVTLTVE
jgi:sugar lactone lactonase YvrE